MTLCEHINSMTYIAYLMMKNSELGKYKALKLMKICLINTRVEKVLSKLKIISIFKKKMQTIFI